MPESNSPLSSMVARAESLYSLPAVAMEVLRLTDSEQVDTLALKECIERDPALAAKLLRVVNSSLFGLSGKVENLTQALALLGIKPLKLLVLGFSLPDGLLADIEIEQLQNYWRGALARAVVARQLYQTQWQAPGDDAFLVALLQDIGMLVLLQQLGAPYARFLTQVRSERGRLGELERSSLGFDHRELTVELLRNWQLPSMYSDAILRTPKKENTVAVGDPSASIPQVLQLADLLVELVDEHRLQVLPALLELGERYCGMTKDDLHKLIAELEPQVEQLAGVLQIDLGDREKYADVLVAAHLKLSQVAEDTASRLIAKESELCDEVLAEAQDLEKAFREFAQCSTPPTTIADTGARADGPQFVAPGPRSRYATASQVESRQRLLTSVATAVTSCRQQRNSLSLLLLEPDLDHHQNASTLEIDRGAALQAALRLLTVELGISSEHVCRLSASSLAIILPGTERRDAVEIAHNLAAQLADPAHQGLLSLDLNAGAAYIAAIPKAFDSRRLLDAAESCLAAARSSGGTVAKSIEVY